MTTTTTIFGDGNMGTAIAGILSGGISTRIANPSQPATATPVTPPTTTVRSAASPVTPAAATVRSAAPRGGRGPPE